MASQKIASVSDIAPGSKKVFFIQGKRIMVANLEGKFFAVDDLCTHAACSLGGEGFLDSNVVTCGCHGSQFDVTSGKVMSLPATVDLVSYPVKVEGTDLFIEL